jgi:hypothetical protein
MGKFKQASPLKFYIAKYFFLALTFLQWVVSIAFFFRSEQNLRSQYTSLYFFTLGSLTFVLYLVISDKLKRVALGKKKIIVIHTHRKQKIDWSDVCSLKLVPFINVYRLKQKGKKKRIYFFPSKNIDPLYSMLANGSGKMENLIKEITP